MPVAPPTRSAVMRAPFEGSISMYVCPNASDTLPPLLPIVSDPAPAAPAEPMLPPCAAPELPLAPLLEPPVTELEPPLLALLPLLATVPEPALEDELVPALPLG